MFAQHPATATGAVGMARQSSPGAVRRGRMSTPNRYRGASPPPKTCVSPRVMSPKQHGQHSPRGRGISTGGLPDASGIQSTAPTTLATSSSWHLDSSVAPSSPNRRESPFGSVQRGRVVDTPATKQRTDSPLNSGNVTPHKKGTGPYTWQQASATGPIITASRDGLLETPTHNFACSSAAPARTPLHIGLAPQASPKPVVPGLPSFASPAFAWRGGQGSGTFPIAQPATPLKGAPTSTNSLATPVREQAMMRQGTCMMQRTRALRWLGQRRLSAGLPLALTRLLL